MMADIDAHEIVFPFCSWSNKHVGSQPRSFGQGVMDDDDWSFRHLRQINSFERLFLPTRKQKQQQLTINKDEREETQKEI